MYFNVIFTTRDSKNGKQDSLPLVEKLGQPGIDMLDLIREETPGLTDLPSRNIHIDNSCPINGSQVEFNISEDLARESGLFKGKTYIVVVVPESYFTRFIKFTTQLRHRDRTIQREKRFIGFVLKTKLTEKYLDSAETSYKFEKEKVISTWKEDGFPLRWGF